MIIEPIIILDQENQKVKRIVKEIIKEKKNKEKKEKMELLFPKGKKVKT